MTPRTARLVRGGLLALALGIGLAVVSTLRRPTPIAPATAPRADPAAGSRTHRLEWRGFKGERESWVLRAESMVGREQEELRLRGVVLTFTYTARGQPGTSTISADECVYSPALQRAFFKGRVVVRTEDGFELRTESLIYRGDKGIAKSEEAVEFSRKDTSGRSTGMLYLAEEGRLDLVSDVLVRVADEDAVPTEIRSQRAVAEREGGTMRFTGGVLVTQGADVLRAGKLTVNFSGEDRAIYRALAVDDVELRTSGARPVAGLGAIGGGKGPLHLTGRKLDLWFREDRSLHEATAGPDADLLVLPGPGEPPERRRLKARLLIFRFDEQGSLHEVQGQKDASFAEEPVPPARGVARSVSCGGFVARFDPATGEAQIFDFNKEVVFTRGSQRATAEVAWYDGPKSLLILKGSPRLVDESEGSELTAVAIDLWTRSGDVAARHNVKHLLRGKRSGLLGSGESPTLLSCRFFDYEAAARTARYRDDALLRSGPDEIRAGEIRIQEREEGGRILTAAGGVGSVLSPRREEGKARPERVLARAREMSYDESRKEVVYVGDVLIRQGDIETRSTAATLTLTPDGRGLAKLVAGEPVEVRQGDRVATGSRGTYTPADETMVLVGDEVTLRDPGQEVHGRSLTFRVGDDTILVDGQEQVRTTTIIRKSKEPPRP